MAESRIPTDRQVAEAIAWLVKFESGELSPEQQQAFEQWHNQSPHHALAWQRLGRATQIFSTNATLDSSLAMQTLNHADRALQSRRRVLKTMLSVGGVGTGLWLSRHYTGADQVGRYLYGRTMADITTAPGQQRQLTLQDGSQLLLNTQSALDIDFDAQPPLTLHFGELAISHSAATRVRAGSNLIRPVKGSEFTLYRQDQRCQLQVIKGSVDCIIGGENWHINAGQQLLQQGDRIERGALDPHSLSWRQGLLTASRTTLGDFIQQLGRYRPGYLGCADEITALTLSGSFPIDNTDAILENLCQILPVRQQRMSRYWVRLLPA